MADYQLATTRPEKIFLLDKVIQNNSIIDAAITGELYYWIAKGYKPWRKAEDYAEMFKVNEKTIRQHFSTLAGKEYRYLHKTRPRLDNGGFGAYQFSANKTHNSRVLQSVYTNILNNSSINHDYGEFDCDEPTYKEIPRIQLLHVPTVQRLQCIKSAYMLGRICWALVKRGQYELYFSDKAHLARWSSLRYRTAFRIIEKLAAMNEVYYCTTDNQLVVGVAESETQQYFSEYMEGMYDHRKQMLAEYVA